MASLTFRAWYTAQWGKAAWQALDKIPKEMWMNYLVWAVGHVCPHGDAAFT